MKRFHIEYAAADDLAAMADQGGERNWAAMHNRMDNMYRFDNPDLPTLQPWMNTTFLPSTRFIGARNPYYHRVDEAGRQLPYIDRVVLTVADGKLIPAKAGAGESDLQSRAIYFNNFTFLKANEERNEYVTRLWRTAKGAHLALYPNLNINDPVWREVFRDQRFRRALSLAIDRSLVNQTLYYGLAIEGNNTVLPASPLFRSEYQTAWTEYDTETANRFLDEMGLTERNGAGTRLLPDGRPMDIIVETAGEETRADGRLGAGARRLGRDRRSPLFQTLATRGLSQPHLRRRDSDLDLGRLRERGAHARHEPGRARSDHAAIAPVAEVGPVLRDQWRRRRGARPARGGRARAVERGVARCEYAR